MNYYYYQLEGGNETWKPIRQDKLDEIEGAMFRTILSVDSPVPDDADKEQLAGTRYSGDLYFDLDDAASPASTAVHAKELVSKLEDQNVFPSQLEIYASGGKGFHIIVPKECFMVKPPKAGFVGLPAIYKEMAFTLSVVSMDFRVYTARKGRMFRCANVKRPNGLYKVRISYEELCELVDVESKEEAEEVYKRMCSAPRKALDVSGDSPSLASGMLALFDQCKSKVSKSATKTKRKKPTVMPKEMPSFDALLRGEGLKADAGFHQIAIQVAITAHARGMSREDLVAAAAGLCDSHESDGFRYNTASKRRAELGRMWEYTEDNPCYEYSPGAVTALLTHNAPDMHGIQMTEDEVAEAISEQAEGEEQEGDEYGHAGLIMTRQGAFTLTENGPKMVTAISFDNVTELVSTDDNRVSVLEADVFIGGKKVSNGTTLELDSFNSVGNVNKMLMRHGQVFSGNDVQARGLFLRLIQKARKANRRMFVSSREGLDYVKIPGHEDDQARKGFLIWSDGRGVSVAPSMADLGIQMKFVGYPDPHGQFQTDIDDAPKLVEFLKNPEEKESMRMFLQDLLHCQSAAHISKLLGWMVAAYWRMMFHEKFDKFPLLHINGAAGQGKCLGVDTPILLIDGTIKMVQDIVVGDKLLGPDGTVRNVLSTVSGREQLYKVTPVKGDAYVVNESHILSLRKSDRGNLNLANGRVVRNGEDVVNVDVKTIYDTPAKISIKLKGWRASALEFPVAKSDLPVDPYWLGAWLGDGNSSDVAIYKPECNMTRWLHSYAEKLGMTVTEYAYPGKCSGWAITNGPAGGSNPLRQFILDEMGEGKHIPLAYKTASLEDRLQLLAGLLDSDGNMAYSGYDWISKDQKFAEDFAFLCRSVGLAAYIQPCQKGIKSTGFVGNYWRVHVSGDCEKVPCLDKKAPPRKQVKRHLVHGITVTKLEVGDYYGFELDGDKLFLLGDFTVTHNTETTKLFCNLHYFNTEPKMLTPTSTLFAVAHSMAGSSSIPLVLDEFKPAEMNPQLYDKFKLLLRDAYNCRAVERGGGTRENSDYRSVHRTQLSAPLIFISEAAESESALMERVVLITQIKPPAVQASENYLRFSRAVANKELLGVFGKYIAASVVKRETVDTFAEEFNVIYNATRKDLMLSSEDVDLSPEELSKKSGAKERTVFNYSVVKFGLQKLGKLIAGIYGDEFDDIFADMQAQACSSVDDIQAQTVPEWLKVLNTFTDMAHVDPESTCFLVKGKDYAVVSYAGQNCMEFNLRACYHKYRQYMALSRTKPLFPGESAFLFAMGNTPSLVAKQHCVDLEVPGGSYIFSLAELRANGYLAP